MSLLGIDKLSLSFGGLKAVSDFSLALPEGALQGLIGPNGAGKTTCFNLMTGVYRPHEGSITLGGKSLIGLKPFQIAAAGVARTFQNIRLFGELSVLDNVKIGCHLRTGHSIGAAVFRLPSHFRAERAMHTKSEQLLEIFGLADRATEQARNLPYGDQRRLEIARAIATDPRVLLLDEPAAGMNPQEKIALKGLIALVRKEFKLTVLLIEHDMGLVMDICERITVLDHGQVIAEGTPADVQGNPKVIEAYLGAPEGAA